MQLNPWEYEDDRKLTDSSENISIAQSENQQQQQQQQGKQPCRNQKTL